MNGPANKQSRTAEVPRALSRMEALEIPCVEHELDDTTLLDIDDADPWALNVVVECKKCGKTGIGIIWADRVMWDDE